MSTYGTTTSDGLRVGFVSADHYQRAAAAKAARKIERQRLERENRLRIAAGLEPIREQLELFQARLLDEPAPKRQGGLF